jgi:DNA invertase Pin-like site-specific DNA recombinase
MPLAFRAACAAFAERVPRLLAAHWFRWFNSVAPEAAASRRHPEMIGASPLTKVGCERLFTDKASGAPARGPGLADALSHLRKGDSLVVWKLDRLGRSVRSLMALVAEFETRQVHFRSLTGGIDTKTPAGRFCFYVMASLAQMERELIVWRTSAGLGAASSSKNGKLAPAR